MHLCLQAISALRAKLSGAADDSGILVDGMSSLVPTDMNSLTFTRNVTQVRSTSQQTFHAFEMGPAFTLYM